MASLRPNIDVSPNVQGAATAYTQASKMFLDALDKPFDNLNKYVADMEKQKLLDEERAIRNEKLGWDREDRARKSKEQEAFDKYFGTIAKGEQIKEGVLNTNELITESNKYDLTPEEQAKYSMYKGDAVAARAAGDAVLADKIDWQMKLSGVADRLPESGIANEGRVGMYERAMGMVTDAGLPISKEMIAAVDAARLADQTAKKDKKEDIVKQLAELDKQELDMQKYYGNKIGGASMIDEDGNPVTLSSRNKSQKDLTKGIAEGTTALAEAVNKMEGLSPEEKAAATKLATDQFNLIISRGVAPEAAAEFISNGLSSKDTGMWFWSGKEPKLNTDMVNKFVDTYKVAEAKLGAADTVGVTRDTSKEDYARDLLMLTSQNNATKRAQLQSELAALDMTADERREVGLSELLRKNGVLPQVDTEVSDGKVTSSGNATSFPGEGKTKADRNNNPGNLTGDDKWKGMVGKDGRFVQFQSYEMGSRALAKNLMNGAVGKTIEDYVNKYAPNSENDTKSYINHVTKALGKEPGSVITNADVLPLMKVIAKHEGGKVDEAKLEAGYKLATALNGEGFKEAPIKKESSKSVKELFGESEVISEYKNKKAEQEQELSSSAYARTFGPTVESGKYAKIWEESDSKKGSTLNKNISTLANAMRKDGISTYEEVASLYNSMPKGPDKDAVKEVLNYKGMQSSQEWRDAKAKEQYLEAGLTAISAIPGAGKGIVDILEQPLKNKLLGQVEKTALKKVLLDPTLAGESKRVAAKALLNDTKTKQEGLKRLLEKATKDSEEIRRQILAQKRPSADQIAKQDALADYVARLRKEIAESDVYLATILNTTK